MWSKWPHLFGQNTNRHDVVVQKGVQKRVTMYITECDIHVIKSDEMKWRSWIHQNHENKWIRRWSKSGSKMSTPNINKAAMNLKKGSKKGVQKWAPFEQKGPSQRLNGFQKWTQNWKDPKFDGFRQKVGTHFWGSIYQWGLIKRVNGKTEKGLFLSP